MINLKIDLNLKGYEEYEIINHLSSYLREIGFLSDFEKLEIEKDEFYLIEFYKPISYIKEKYRDYLKFDDNKYIKIDRYKIIISEIEMNRIGLYYNDIISPYENDDHYQNDIKSIKKID